MLQNVGLLFGSGPILLFHGLGQAGQFQVRVGEAGAVENVFEPGASGNAVGVEPVALDLHHAVVQLQRNLGIRRAGRELVA